MRQQNYDLTGNLKQICGALDFIESVYGTIEFLNNIPNDPPKKPSKVQQELDRLGRVLDGLSDQAKAHIRRNWENQKEDLDNVLKLFSLALQNPCQTRSPKKRDLAVSSFVVLALVYDIPIVQTDNSKFAWLIEIICEEANLPYNSYEIIREIRITNDPSEIKKARDSLAFLKTG